MFENRMSVIARISCFAQSVIFLVVLVVASPVHAQDDCSQATPVEINTTFRGYADVGEPLLVELELPSAGILSVDLVVPHTFSAGVANGILNLECLPRLAPEPIVLERSPEHQVLAVKASGAYTFQVASLDRHRALGELKLRSAFVPAAATGGHGYGENEDEIEIDGFGDPSHNYGENEDEIEIDGFADPSHNYGENEDEIEIDGFADPSHEYGENEDEIEIDGFADPSHEYGENEDEIEIDGFADPSHNYGENEDEIEIDGFADPSHNYGENEDEIEIDGFAAPEKLSLSAGLRQLCRLGETDDHGDSFACATSLKPGDAIRGEIGNGWGDDVDTFRFELGGTSADLRIVTIETLGNVGTVGVLFNQHGQRLERIDNGGYGENFRIVRALRPGVYYVRVEGFDSAEGDYSLRVSAAP